MRTERERERVEEEKRKVIKKGRTTRGATYGGSR